MESRVDLAVLHLVGGRSAQALTQLGRALEAAPEDVRARLHRALALREVSRAEEADVALRQLADDSCDADYRARARSAAARRPVRPPIGTRPGPSRGAGRGGRSLV